MASKSLELVKVTRLKWRVKLIHGCKNLAFIFFCVAVGFVVYAAGFPQKRQVEALEQKLQLALDNEKAVIADLGYHQIELHALKTDPSFLEIRARDRLNFYREGERILKFSKEAKP
jgi:hypothetical protein